MIADALSEVCSNKDCLLATSRLTKNDIILHGNGRNTSVLQFDVTDRNSSPKEATAFLTAMYWL